MGKRDIANKFNRLSVEDLEKMLKKEIEEGNPNNAMAYFLSRVIELKKDERFDIVEKIHFLYVVSSNKNEVQVYLRTLTKEDLPYELISSYFDIIQETAYSSLLKKYQFDEGLLEQHFKAFGPTQIFYNQMISEDFYIKHFTDFKYCDVMNSPNKWKYPSFRSNKLRIFLKLNGGK